MSADGPEQRTAEAEERARLDAALDRASQALGDELPGDDALLESALIYRAQRERARRALKDLIFGAQMLLDLPGQPEDAFIRYVREVKRVAEGGL